MATRHFHIKITPDAVDVSTSESAHASRRPGVNVAMMVAGVGFFLWQTFRTDRYGYTLWRCLERYPRHSWEFRDALFGMVVMALVTGLFFILGLRGLFPSGETVHCDRSTLTVSKIPFVSFRGKWRTRTFELLYVCSLRYTVLQSGRGESTYGIRFLCGGKQTMLAGLTAPQAYRILGALKILGADVPEHREMRYVVREALRDRREQL
jgi:hypothetical protein